MPRSNKKGPYVNEKLLKKIHLEKASVDPRIIKTWARGSMITPDMIGLTFAVHNGRRFIPVYVTEHMVGHKLGEFSPTRLFKGHSSKKIAEAGGGKK